MKLFLSENDMKLKYPFSISRHTYYSQPNLTIELHDQGVSGYGEATINPYYHITIDNLKSAFELMKLRLESYKFSTPDVLFDDFSDLSTNKLICSCSAQQCELGFVWKNERQKDR
jgi:hypothetical protein